MDTAHDTPPGLVILGSGASSGTPAAVCLMSDRDCACRKAKEGTPMLNDNYRLCPSALLRLSPSAHVILDAGKMFRNAAITWLPLYGCTRVDAVLLTHSHADAAHGMDDLRGCQRFDHSAGDYDCTQVFASDDACKDLHRTYPYLFPHLEVRDGGVTRAVSNVSLHHMYTHVPVQVKRERTNRRELLARSDAAVATYRTWPPCENSSEVAILPLLVWHGNTYETFGFEFWTRRQPALPSLSACLRQLRRRLRRKFEHVEIDDERDEAAHDQDALDQNEEQRRRRIVYISDVSSVPSHTREWLQKWPIDLLVLDCVFRNRNAHPAHFCWPQTLDFIREMRPHKCLLTGMTCDLEFNTIREELDAKYFCDAGIEVMPGRDGLFIPLRL